MTNDVKFNAMITFNMRPKKYCSELKIQIKSHLVLSPANVCTEDLIEPKGRFCKNNNSLKEGNMLQIK